MLGVFDALRTPQPPEALATACSLDPIWTTCLLTALAAEGFLARDGGMYRTVKVPAQTTPVAGAALLADLFRRQKPLAWSEIAGNPDAAALTVPLTDPDGAIARELVREVSPVLASGGLFVDIGCGSGRYDEQLLVAAPRATALLVDRAQVLPQAASRMSRFGDRVQIAAADAVTYAPPPSRTVIVAQLLHLLQPSEATALVQRIARTLAPGGMLAIIEIALDDDSPAHTAWFGLSLLVHGLPPLWSRAQLEACAKSAGLVEIASRDVQASPTALLLTARAPVSTLYVD